MLIMLGLLIAPVLAVARLKINLVWSGVFALGISALTFLVYAYDKRQAQAEGWRLPENPLHLELLGGWPGAFLAQRWLRHKCVKVGYQIVFWLIVLAYQFVAIDCCSVGSFVARC